jgi:hypothetical protein
LFTAIISLGVTAYVMKVRDEEWAEEGRKEGRKEIREIIRNECRRAGK